MGWRDLLKNEVWQNKLGKFLDEEFNTIIRSLSKCSGPHIVPKKTDIFNAFKIAPNDIYVVLLGMDPYPTPGVANGLSFSFIPNEENKTCPPSLKNIFREIRESVYNNGDVHDDFFNTDLTRWMKQGVFLFNTALTTEEGLSGRHILQWKKFTEEVIRILNKSHPMCIILLGSHAKYYKPLFDGSHHYILEAGHPSPLNKKVPFLGSNVFKDCNTWLKKTYNLQIEW